MNDPVYALLGQYVAAGQELKDKLEFAIAVIQKLKSGELTLDQVLTVPGGIQILPKVESKNGVEEVEEVVPA